VASVVFFGSGILLYAILWIVIPRAITRADRMAMKGEKLNLQGFKNNFEEELSSVRNHLSNLHSEAQPFIYRLRDFASEFFHHLGQFLRGTGNVLVKVLGILILLACLGFSVFLVVCLCLVTIWADTHMHMFPFSITSSEYANRIFVAGFVAAFIPVLAIFLVTIKGIFNARSVDRSVGSIIFVVWLFAVGVLAFYGTKIASGFKSSATFKQTINIATPSKGIYYLKLNDVKYFTHEDSVRLNMKADFQNMIVTNENNNTYEEFEMNNISIKIEKSDVNQPVLIETFRAKGREYEDALINARKTKYIFTQKDSVLTFDRYLQRLPDVGWHDQQIELTLKVPLNTVVIIDDRLNDLLRDGIDVNECKDKNKMHDVSSAPFIMTANGLECKVDTLVIAKPDSTKILKAK